MKRFAMADIIGTGEMDVDDFRPAVADYPVDYSCWSGAPVWGLVEMTRASDEAIALMSVDPRIDMLPNVPRPTLIGDMDPLLVDGMRAAMDRREIGAALVDDASTFGEVIDAIMQRANAG